MFGRSCPQKIRKHKAGSPDARQTTPETGPQTSPRVRGLALAGLQQKLLFKLGILRSIDCRRRTGARCRQLRGSCSQPKATPASPRETSVLCAQITTFCRRFGRPGHGSFRVQTSSSCRNPPSASFASVWQGLLAQADALAVASRAAMDAAKAWTGTQTS